MAIQKGFEKWVSLTGPHNAVLYYLANFMAISPFVNIHNLNQDKGDQPIALTLPTLK